MDQYLEKAAKSCWLLASASIALGLLAAPVGMARADNSTPPVIICGGKHANGCTAPEEITCNGQGTRCRALGVCDCKWSVNFYPPYNEYCGCYSNAPTDE
jgi:hypothetical protein